MKAILLLLSAVGWLLMLPTLVEAQGIHRDSLVGTWCEVRETPHTEVYNRDQTVIWSEYGVQYQGIWYWLPLAEDHIIVEFGERRILLRVRHVDGSTLSLQDIRTGRVRYFRRGLCTAGG